MNPIKYLFYFYIIFIKNSLEEKPKYLICEETVPKIDATIIAYGQDLVLLIAGNLVYKLEFKTQDLMVVLSEDKLENISSDIRTPIEYIDTSASNKKFIDLMNCDLKIKYNIRYIDKHFIRSDSFGGCGNAVIDIELIIHPISGKKYYLQRYPNADMIGFENVEQRRNLVVFYWTKDPMEIILLDQKNFNSSPLGPEVKPYKTMNENEITAALIYDNNWYLFGGRTYCKVRLNEKSFQTCKPIAITELILNCHSESESSVLERVVKNTDISVYIIIIVIIIAFSGIVIFVIVLYIAREIQRKTSKASYGSSNTSF